MLYKKIKQFLKNNYEELSSKIDFDKMINEIPSTLKEEMIFYQYGKLIKDLAFFQYVKDNDCVWAILQKFYKIKFDTNQVIYSEGEPSDIMFFIHKGKVHLRTENGYQLRVYGSGENFGDAEMLSDTHRNGTAIAVDLS